MARARVAIDKAREREIPAIFIQEVHRLDLVDFGRELDDSEGVHCPVTNPGTAIAIDEMGFIRSIATAMHLTPARSPSAPVLRPW